MKSKYINVTIANIAEGKLFQVNFIFHIQYLSKESDIMLLAVWDNLVVQYVNQR